MENFIKKQVYNDIYYLPEYEVSEDWVVESEELYFYNIQCNCCGECICREDSLDESTLNKYSNERKVLDIARKEDWIMDNNGEFYCPECHCLSPDEYKLLNNGKIIKTVKY